MARSGSFIGGRTKRDNEVKTALSGVRNELDRLKPRMVFQFTCQTTDLTLTRRLLPWWETQNASVTETFILLPFACEVKSLFIFWDTVGTGSGSLKFTVKRNQETTSLVTTVPVVGTQGFEYGSVRFEAGDRLSVEVVPVGTVTASPTWIYASMEAT